MPEIKFNKPIKCPSCTTISWTVGLEEHRVTMDCSLCEYRLSLPLDMDGFEEGGMCSGMPLEYDYTRHIQS